MATTIQIKRSTGTSAPGSLAAGELGVTFGTGTASNLGDRLFIGDGSNVDVIGGKFFSDMLDHTQGTLTCLLYTSPSPRDATLSRMPSSA